MFSSVQKLSATFVIATSLASASSLAMAAPVTNGSAMRNATPSTVETVRWWWGGSHSGLRGGRAHRRRAGSALLLRLWSLLSRRLLFRRLLSGPLLPWPGPLRRGSRLFRRGRRRRRLLRSTVQIL